MIDLVVFTRDRHPPDHFSFREQGGPFPAHCVAGTPGADIHPDLQVPAEALVIDAGRGSRDPGFDKFEGTSLGEALRRRRINRCLIGGLATDYCVRATALGAIARGFETWVVTDAISAVDAKPGDGQRALLEMRARGAHLTDAGQITSILKANPAPTALIVVDVQRDFCSGGALEVPGAERIFPALQSLLQIAKTKKS